MPLTNNELRTKLSGTADPYVQQTLQDIAEGRQKLRQVRIVETKVQLLTDHGLITAGRLKEEYREFLESLHEPQITTQVTGGGYKLLNEKGQVIRDLYFTSLLSHYEKEMIALNYYELRPLYRGMNICIINNQF